MWLCSSTAGKCMSVLSTLYFHLYWNCMYVFLMYAYARKFVYNVCTHLSIHAYTHILLDMVILPLANVFHFSFSWGIQVKRPDLHYNRWPIDMLEILFQWSSLAVRCSVELKEMILFHAYDEILFPFCHLSYQQSSASDYRTYKFYPLLDQAFWFHLFALDRCPMCTR